MSIPTLSSTTPMSDWFANVNLICNNVQRLTDLCRSLQDRIAVLEAHAHIPRAEPRMELDTVEEKAKKPKKATKAKAEKTEKTKTKKVEKSEKTEEEKKRGRKPMDFQLSQILREGEQVIARIPLGDRRFDEHAAVVRDGKLVLEDGQSFDHPSTLVGSLAKILEAIGERSTDCSRSMNGWLLCTVTRNGKKIALEKLKSSSASEAAGEAAETTTEVTEIETA